jgi:predicted RNA-binding Zn-ribbon protein involved in translation (DUF1610 family)
MHSEELAMAISMACPSCKKKLKAKEELAGRRVKCPGCGNAVLIPGASAIAEVVLDREAMLMEVIAESDPMKIAQAFLEHDFTLIETPDQPADGKAAVTAEVEGFPVILAFISEEHARRLAGAVPDMLNASGALDAFVVSGADFLETLPDELGILLNAGSEDTVLVPPDLVQAIKEAVRELTPGHSQAQAVRQASLAYLTPRGFLPADGLPLPVPGRQLRDGTEIARRLMGLAAVFTWGSAPADAVPSERVRDFIKKNQLRQSFTPAEVKILSTPRAEARQQYAHSVGWKLENMWPLAWVLGFEHDPTIEASQIDHSIGGSILFDLLDGLQRDLKDVVGQWKHRSVDEVISLEDRFYCAHNAVRSAQLGEETVPGDFHPVEHGGAVHERRHALTWCLSPNTTWEETDLST